MCERYSPDHRYHLKNLNGSYRMRCRYRGDLEILPPLIATETDLVPPPQNHISIICTEHWCRLWGKISPQKFETLSLIHQFELDRKNFQIRIAETHKHESSTNNTQHLGQTICSVVTKMTTTFCLVGVMIIWSRSSWLRKPRRRCRKLHSQEALMASSTVHPRSDAT